MARAKKEPSVRPSRWLVEHQKADDIWVDRDDGYIVVNQNDNQVFVDPAAVGALITALTNAKDSL